MSPPPATPGRNRRATGRRPEYVVEIDISPQLRARDPGRPLSLSEALDTGPARRRDTAARGPEVRPARHPAATPAGSQLPGTLQPTAAGRAGNIGTAGTSEHPAADRDPGEAPAADVQAAGPAQAVRSVRCPCTAPPGWPCGPSGDHLARYLRAEQRGAIARQHLLQVIEGLDVITPNLLIRPPDAAAPPTASGRPGRPSGSRSTPPPIQARPGNPAEPFARRPAANHPSRRPEHDRPQRSRRTRQ